MTGSPGEQEPPLELAQEQTAALDRALYLGLTAMALPSVLGMIAYFATSDLGWFVFGAGGSVVGFLAALWMVSRALRVPYASAFRLSTLADAVRESNRNDGAA